MNLSISQQLSTKDLIRFALPSVFMMLAMSFYTIVDGIFISTYVNSKALAGLNIAYPAFGIIGAVAMMFGTGGSAYVAHRMSVGQANLANRSFTFIVVAMVIISILLCVPAIIFIRELCIFLGASDDLLQYSVPYLRILMVFAPAAVLQMLFQCFFVTASRPYLGFIFTSIGGVINIAFDYLFIVEMQLGISGAAYATAMGLCVPAIGGLYFFSRNPMGLRFSWPVLRWSILGKSMFNGSSEMVSIASQSFTAWLFNISMMAILGPAGPAGVSALSAALYTQWLMISAVFGFSIGVAPIISYHHGAKNNAYLRKIVKQFTYIVVSFSFVTFLVTYFGASILADVFFSGEPDVHAMAVKGLRIFAFSFIFVGSNIFGAALFTALGNGFVSGMIAFAHTFAFLVASIYGLSHFWGEVGLWASVPCAEFLGIFVYLYYRKTKFPQYGLI